MLVARIKEFMNDLKAARGAPCDAEIYTQLITHFAGKEVNSSLTEVDYQFLEEQFALRWAAVKTTDEDYTLNPEGINARWITLAKDLSSWTTTYIKILFPDIINVDDPISSVPLKDTINTDNLYLGHGGRILYRKHGLCQHLMDKDYVLSTRRRMDSPDPLTLTVEELSRLKACQSKRKITVTEEDFSNFWEFVQRKVLNKLNSSNELPLSLLSHFLPLIGRYFVLKKAGANFLLFTNELNSFFDFLNKHDKDEINQFYGVHFTIKGRKYYLVDFLIALADAKDYSLDADLKHLMNSLYSINPALRIKNSSVDLFYTDLAPYAGDSLLTRCRLMLLSLFTINFQCSSWDKETISICDKENVVFPQVARIYKSFEPALLANNDTEMVSVYEKVLKANVEAQSKASNLSRLWTCIFSSPFNVWFEQVKEGSLSSLGFRWHDPKLLIHALVRFRAATPVVGRFVEGFLDELIQTYCQVPPISKFQKHMRINILFNQFLNRLEATNDRDALLLLIDLYATQDYRSNFINNCASHIGERLQQINGGKKSEASLTFFSGSRKIEQVKSKIDSLGITSVNDVISVYRDEISQDCRLKADPIKSRKLLDYLLQVQKKIFTCAEELDVERSVRVGVDSIGAPT